MFYEPSRVDRLLIVKGLRAFGDGYVSLLLPVYLVELGFNPLQVGIIATTTLIGSGLLTLAVGLHAWRFHYRSLLLATSALMAGTGLGFALLTDFWPLLLVALVGTLNPSSGDVSVFLEDIENNRSDAVHIIDIRLDKAFTFGGKYKVTGFFDVYNLMNANPETNFILRTGSNFNNIIEWIQGRTLKVGARFQF